MLVEKVFTRPELWPEIAPEPDLERERRLDPCRHRRQGEAAVLLCLLERRFGPLAAATRERVEAAGVERLLEWEERVLGAERLEDVFGD